MLKLLVLAFVVATMTYFVGGLSGRHDIFPRPQISAVNHIFSPQVAPQSRYVFDDMGRLIGDEQKITVRCPEPGDRTAVLLVLGQSNAANYFWIGGRTMGARRRYQFAFSRYIDAT